MAIDVKTAFGDGWWLLKSSRKLLGRLDRLTLLNDWFTGNPPLPLGTENMRPALDLFQRMSRTSYAELIVEAARERMKPNGFYTALSSDGVSDDIAWEIWQANGLDVEIADVFTSMLALGDGYMIIGGDAESGPIITGEDPRQVVTFHDPVQQRIVRCGAKFFHDPDLETDFGYLYMPGGFDADGVHYPAYVRVAVCEGVRTSTPRTPTFTPSSWSWVDDLGGFLSHDLVPVVRFRNRRGVSEFEPHLDILGRLTHQTLQRMTIATYQAFRQRAIKVDPNDMPDKDPATGLDIDYNDILAADPGALWKLPLTADLWESGQVDLTPILAADKADVVALSGVSRTPLATLMPGDGNESAEGASFKREGLTFKTEDRIRRATEGLKDVMSIALSVAGETSRADRAKLQVLWEPVERVSMAEKYDAASKGLAAGVARKTVLIKVLGFSPREADENEVLLEGESALVGKVAPAAPVAAFDPFAPVVAPSATSVAVV